MRPGIHMTIVIKVFQTVPHHPVQDVANCTGQELVLFGYEKRSGSLDHPKKPELDRTDMVWYRTGMFRPIWVRFESDNVAMDEKRIFSQFHEYGTHPDTVC